MERSHPEKPDHLRSHDDVRRRSRGEVQLRDVWRVVGREISAGFLLGLLLGVAQLHGAGRSDGEREADGELRAAVGCPFGGDPAPLALDDGLGDGEAEAEARSLALLGGAAAMKAIEQA